MGDGDAEPGLLVQVKDVQPGTARYGQVVALAAQVLAQHRYLVSSVPGAQESHVLGAFGGIRCTGFPRYLIQVIGAEAGRPAVMRNGEPLRKGYVEAFGVDPRLRRRGIGTALQQHAARHSYRRLPSGGESPVISGEGENWQENLPPEREVAGDVIRMVSSEPAGPACDLCTSSTSSRTRNGPRHSCRAR